MLTLFVPNEDGSETVSLNFEHSLVSLSKWEEFYQKPFFSNAEKTPEEGIKYIQLMLLTPNVPESFVDRMSKEQFLEINIYVNASLTATTFRDQPGEKPSTQIHTSELIYSWMIAFGIYESAANWHLSRLLTLIKIRGIQSTQQKPMNKKAQMEEYRKLNEERRRQLGTSG